MPGREAGSDTGAQGDGYTFERPADGQRAQAGQDGLYPLILFLLLPSLGVQSVFSQFLLYYVMD
jgi:hypothetical protein